MELAASKAINRISIVDIVENCSLTKPTFYRCFKDLLKDWDDGFEQYKGVGELEKIGYENYLIEQLG